MRPFFCLAAPVRPRPPRRQRRGFAGNSASPGENPDPADAASDPKESAVYDVVAHVFTGLPAARLAGAAGIQADTLHLRAPFLVVIPAPRRFAEGLLPDVGHLMD